MGYRSLVLLTVLAAGAFSPDGSPASADSADSADVAPLRVIVSTDFPPLDVIPVKAAKKGDPPERCSDPDDLQSMVRFLLYTNELEVEGLVASAGTSPTSRTSRTSLISCASTTKWTRI